MIVKELILHNFGIYAGSNVFTFEGSRPIVLIGGMNGRGKTTFLDAVLIALYGSSSFAYTESNYKSYSQYLRSFVNKSDGTNKTYVALEFTTGVRNVETYRIQRSWTGEKRRITEQIQVWKNGKADDFLAGNWPLFIENLMPRGLSNFFFFDGEKIAELAGEETSDPMKESIKMLLGISVIDTLQGDLARMVNRVEKKLPDSTEAQKIDALRTEREQASDALAQAERELANLRLKREQSAKQIEGKKQMYSAKGGDIYAQKQQLYTDRTTTMAHIVALEERLVADAASELPFSMVRELLTAIHRKAEYEHEQKLLGSTLSKLETLFEDYNHTDITDRAAVACFIEYVRGTVQQDFEYVFGELSDSSVSKLKVLLDSQLAANRRDVQMRKIELADQRRRKEQLDNYLSVEIDEKALSELYRQIKELEQEQISLDVQIQRKEDDCRSLNGKSMAATAAFRRALDVYIDKVDLIDDNERILKYAHKASAILEEYTKRLQGRKVTAVASTMTECYKALANKTTLIDRIEMDPVTLDLHFISPEGSEVDRASLSAGEKQLMVISLLWALARCSKKKLPVIIDTPLSRLDSAHRSTVIQTYFPQASEQTIILSTDTEIDQTYYQLMKPNIGDEFTLVYNDQTRSTSISRGYFPGV